MTDDEQPRDEALPDVLIDLGEPAVPRVTVVLLAIVLVMTGYEFVTYGVSPGVSDLARAGGASLGAFVNGAWWKFLTANLLHGGIVHLAMNTVIIYLMGRWLEHLCGRTIVVATILWSGLLASLGSLLVDNASVTIGASGIAFGLVGCAVAADPAANTTTGVLARQLAIINVIGTFVIPGISIGGHLGGLVGGLLIGALTWRRPSIEQTDAVRQNTEVEQVARVEQVAQPAGRSRMAGAALAIALAIPIVGMLAVGPERLFADSARELRGNVGARLLERQLSGAELSNGVTIEDASCEPTSIVQEFACTTDTGPALVRYRSSDDQWRMRIAS